MLMPYNSSEKFVLKYTVFCTISSLAKEGFFMYSFPEQHEGDTVHTAPSGRCGLGKPQHLTASVET